MTPPAIGRAIWLAALLLPGPALAEIPVDLFLDNYSADPQPYKMMLRTSENSADLRLSGIAFSSSSLEKRRTRDTWSKPSTPTSWGA